jgi:hypothetical protein
VTEAMGKRVHLVGSVALSTSAEVFEQVSARVGNDIARLSDGETGGRGVPFPFQADLVVSITKTPGMVFKHVCKVSAELTFNHYGLAPGARAEDIEFGALGFAAAAKESYPEFKQLQAAGKIPADVRMQVGLPTPLLLEIGFVTVTDVIPLWPAFERAMLRELKEIAASIPHVDLAIQWDVAAEICAILEGGVAQLAEMVDREELLNSIARITEAVPLDVQAGWHFCYGDTGVSTEDCETHHIVEPRDLGVLVALANDLCAMIKRPLAWLHMPVPRTRDDSAYFAPLENLRLKPGMQLYLGLVHKRDGLEGAKRRIAAAKAFYPAFGVGTECGLGRRKPEDIPGLLDLHHEVGCAL